MRVQLVRSTYGSDSDAWKAAQELVQKGLAACAHVLMIRSCYTWEGQVQDDAEALLEARCAPSTAAAAARHLREAHPYDVPMIEILESEVDDAYGAWMQQVTRTA